MYCRAAFGVPLCAQPSSVQVFANGGIRIADHAFHENLVLQTAAQCVAQSVVPAPVRRAALPANSEFAADFAATSCVVVSSVHPILSSGVSKILSDIHVRVSAVTHFSLLVFLLYRKGF